MAAVRWVAGKQQKKQAGHRCSKKQQQARANANRQQAGSRQAATGSSRQQQAAKGEAAATPGQEFFPGPGGRQAWMARAHIQQNLGSKSKTPGGGKFQRLKQCCRANNVSEQTISGLRGSGLGDYRPTWSGAGASDSIGPGRLGKGPKRASAQVAPGWCWGLWGPMFGQREFSLRPRWGALISGTYSSNEVIN